MSATRPRAERRALERISSSPHLAELVPTLAPELLHRAIEARGLEDAGELLVLATPAQLRELADLDLWRAARPGETEAFDADRFAMWLEVLVETDPSRAAGCLADLDRDVATIGLARHVRVFDYAAVAAFETTDGDLVRARHSEANRSAEIGGFFIAARDDSPWDAIVTVLVNLETDHLTAFRELMRAVCALSNSGAEIDGLSSMPGGDEQRQYDARTRREDRRDLKGFVTAGDARAFLQAARNAQSEAARFGRSSSTTIVVASEMARALVAVPEQDSASLSWMRNAMGQLADRHPRIYSARNEELAWLANTLVAGCPIQGRPFGVQEAWDAAVATCNLALERLAPMEGFLIEHDLVHVFQIGWTILHDDVVMRAADELAGVLSRLRCRDAFLQTDMNALGRELTTNLRTGTPWRARRHMDVLASLDAMAWTALLGLIAEYPVRHAAVIAARTRTLSVSPTTFDLISEQSMIDAVHAFLAALPSWLGDEARR